MKLELLNQMKGRDQIPFHLAEIDQWTELHKKKKYMKVKYSCPNSTLFSHFPLTSSSSRAWNVHIRCWRVSTYPSLQVHGPTPTLDK